jgi:hypothetical protein
LLDGCERQRRNVINLSTWVHRYIDAASLYLTMVKCGVMAVY